MSVDKLVDSTQLDADLTSVANAIRTKGGTSAALAFPADFVSAIAAIPSGGGGSVETGSFIATTSDTLTIPVTSLHYFCAFWHEDLDLSMSLSGNPFGAYKTLLRIMISPDYAEGVFAGTTYGFTTNYNGTGWNGFGERGNPHYSSGNQMTFTASSIKIQTMRVGGANRQLVDGATYHWRAW